MVKVLFVCLGNICRSPLAEGSFKKLVSDKGLMDIISCDSAGTSSYHIGERPDERMVSTAAKHGIFLEHFARQLSKDDFEEFDYIIAMDKKNDHNIRLLSESIGGGRAKIFLMRDHDPEKKSDDVPDPYFGGIDGFDEVYQIVQRSCEELLKLVLKDHNLK